MSKYQKRVFLGYDAEGKRVQKRVYADSKKELEQKAYELKHAARRSRIDFLTFSRKWLTVYKANNSNVTRAAYKRILDNDCAVLNDIPLDEITRTDCQSVLNNCSDQPAKAHKVYTTLNQIFSCALLDGHIDKSPMAGLTVPRLNTVTRRALTQAEKDRIASAELASMDRMYMDVLLYLGLRPGEAAALTAEDFDLVAQTVTINKAMEYNPNQPVLKQTKTGSVRVLPIPSGFQPFLPDTGYVFHKDGQPLSKTVFRRMFARIKAAVGESDLHPYVFRYNYATMLFYSGISIKYAAYLMGHADTAMMLRIYAQLDEEQESISTLRSMDFTNKKEPRR